MDSITDIVVRVDLVHKGETLVYSEAIIPLDQGPIRAGDLMDACQRSVAHCVEELQFHLDFDN